VSASELIPEPACVPAPAPEKEKKEKKIEAVKSFI